MLELDIIGAWDARAVNLDQEEADRNVYEFDLTLWNLLSTLAKNVQMMRPHNFLWAWTPFKSCHWQHLPNWKLWPLAC